MKTKLPILLLFCFAITSFAQTPDRQQFIRTEAKLIALTHVRVIDGTGAAAKRRSNYRDQRRKDSVG